MPLLLPYGHTRTHRREPSATARLAPLPVYSPGLPLQKRARAQTRHPVPLQAALPEHVRLDLPTLLAPRCVEIGRCPASFAIMVPPACTFRILLRRSFLPC